jgi:hypothetical protein
VQDVLVWGGRVAVDPAEQDLRGQSADPRDILGHQRSSAVVIKAR